MTPGSNMLKNLAFTTGAAAWAPLQAACAPAWEERAGLYWAWLKLVHPLMESLLI